MELTLLPIHKYPEYLEGCCKLINDEWKRSDTARLHSLQSSCDLLPTSLVLLQNKRLIGHIKLSRIPSITNACFVESVVIDKKLRGKGYGTFLMKAAENYCKSLLHLDTIYLSTKGQERFYSKLGYLECTPISIYGGYMPKTNIVQKNTEDVKNITQPTIFKVPPPPPMPINKITSSTKVFMKKELAKEF